MTMMGAMPASSQAEVLLAPKFIKKAAMLLGCARAIYNNQLVEETNTRLTMMMVKKKEEDVLLDFL